MIDSTPKNAGSLNPWHRLAAGAALAKALATEGASAPIATREWIEHKDGVGNVLVIEWTMPSGRVAVWAEGLQ